MKRLEQVEAIASHDPPNDDTIHKILKVVEYELLPSGDADGPGPSPRLVVEGPIERTQADAPHLRRQHLRKAHAASAHGRGPRLALQNRAAALTTPST